MLKLVQGRVIANDDPGHSGSFQAIFNEISDTPLDVIYTSPAYRRGGGGLLYIPERGDYIFAIHDTTNNRFYYQSTAVGLQYPTTDALPFFENINKNSFYNSYDKPVKVTYENQKGAGLCITSDNTSFNNDLGPAPAPRMIDSVVLKSPLNKRLSLDDSPQTDAIFIKNQHKDGIVISGDSTEIFPAQMIQVKSSGPHNYTCMQSHMDIRVVEGTDITIENNSTGKMGQTPSEDQWPNGSEQQPPKRWGGVYVRSENGDVSLASQATDGRIFISTPNAQIQITEGDSELESNIVIKTSGKISMESEGDIDMRSNNGSIRLEAAGDVDVTAGGLLKTSSSGKTSISSGGDTAIEGSNVLLNSGGTEAPAFATPTEPLLNDYSD